MNGIGTVICVIPPPPHPPPPPPHTHTQKKKRGTKIEGKCEALVKKTVASTDIYWLHSILFYLFLTGS